LNAELQKYFQIFCGGDYPDFIDKYIQTPALQRLSRVSQFCGCDYTKIFECKFWYSRLDHSIACALMAWNFTKDKIQTLAALMHDLGTPCFSHTIDYLMGDLVNQNSSEKSIYEMIMNSEELTLLLDADNIDVFEVCDLSKYPILENERPRLCIDRLDGVLHTGLVWCKFWDLEDIKKIYQHITIFENEDGIEEIGFDSMDVAQYFYDGAHKYAMVLQKNEDKYVMQFISDILKILIDRNLLCIDDLYVMSEEEIINIIINTDDIGEFWKLFSEAKGILRSDVQPTNCYFVSVDCKKRYVVPLVLDKKVVRLNIASSKVEKLLEDYLTYQDTKYGYIEGIFLMNGH